MQGLEHFRHCPPQSNEGSDVATPKVTEVRDWVAQTPDRKEPDLGIGGHTLCMLAAEVNVRWAARAEFEIQ